MRLSIVLALVPWLVGPWLVQEEGPGPALRIEEVREEANRRLDGATAALGEGDHEVARGEAALGIERLLTLPVGEGHDPTAHLLWRLGTVAYQSGDLAAAHAAWQRAVEHFELTLAAEDGLLLAARSNLAAAMKWLGDLEGALRLEEAVAATLERTRPAEDPSLLTALHNLAVTRRDLGQLDEARALFERVLAARERTLPPEHPKLLRTRDNLSTTLMFLGEFEAARALAEEVLAVRARTLPEDHTDLAAARSSLAVILYEIGDFVGARLLFEATAHSYERALPEDHPDLLSARGNLAEAMSVLGDRTGARALQERVVAGYERTFPADHPARLLAQANLGSLALDDGDLAEARRLLAASLKGFDAVFPTGHPHRLRTRRTLATALLRDGEVEAALALAREVLERRERDHDDEHPLVLAARQGLAATLATAGEREEARPIQEAVLEVYERTLQPDHPDRLGLLLDLGITEKETGRFEQAHLRGVDLAQGLLEQLRRGLALSRREARAVAASAAHRHSVARWFTRPRAGQAPDPIRFELAETLRAFALDASRLPNEDARRQDLAAVRMSLNDFVGGGVGGERTPEELSAEVSRLTLERDRLEREIRAAVGVDSERGTVRAAELARGLSEGAAAVGFLREPKWVLDENSDAVREGEVLTAHVLRADGSLVELELGDAEELEALTLAWREGLGRPLVDRGVTPGGNRPREREGERTELGLRLRERLLDPILAVAGEVEELHVAADDFLHVVPLDALPFDGEGVQRVGDRLRIVNELSFRRLLRTDGSAPTDGGLLAVGGVAFDAGPPTDERARALEASAETRGARLDAFVSLPATRDEADVVAALYREGEVGDAAPVLLLGERASRAAFREAAPGMRFLHVATHGWFVPEALASTADALPVSETLWSAQGVDETVARLAPMTLCGLAFSGANAGRDSLGRLPGILTAEALAGLDLYACELAVLSACETNVGIRRAGEGVQSLQAALHAAGARTAITSLWKVGDAATHELFERFYTYLWVDKLGKAEALWKAKCDLRAEGSPVRDWAAWVLSGDPD